jgi:hypothetical protein
LGLERVVRFLGDISSFVDPNKILRTQLGGQQLAVSGDECVVYIRPKASFLKVRIHAWKR